MIKTIVVAAHGDDDATRDAVALGARLARAMQARVVLAGIWVSPLGPGDGVYERAVRAEVERELKVLRAEIPSEVFSSLDIRGATSVVRGLQRVVEDTRADVLVVGPTHHGKLGRLTHGSVAVTAVHDAPCAVAVAPRGYRDAFADDLKDVVVGYDDGPEARAALEAGVEVAAGTGGALRLVHAVETPFQLADRQWVGSPAPETWYEDLRRQARDALAAGEAAAGDRVPVSSHLVEGVPSLEVARAAQDAFLLVVGSRGYGPVKRLVLGSTSTELLAHGTVPVLVVPRSSAHADADRRTTSATATA